MDGWLEFGLGWVGSVEAKSEDLVTPDSLRKPRARNDYKIPILIKQSNTQYLSCKTLNLLGTYLWSPNIHWHTISRNEVDTDTIVDVVVSSSSTCKSN